MGGNLFKLGRLPKADYLQIEREISAYLDDKIGADLYKIPRYYGDKADFGDLDVIISSAACKTNWDDLRQEFKTDLGVQECKAMGNVFSTVYRNFQVDYFVRNERFFESTYAFLCFNDVGNLVGKICRRFNLKYGEEGLTYVYRRADGHYQKDLPISLDWEKIFAFVGLNYSQWCEGFANREDLFKWVLESPYFSVEPYEKLQGNLEKRARQRSTIQYFLTWLEKEGVTKRYQYLEDRDAYLPMIDECFPAANLLEAIAEEKKREAEVIEIRSKFNGRMVMELFPDLSGPSLGAFIKSFRESFSDPDQALFDASSGQIVDWLQAHHADSTGKSEN